MKRHYGFTLIELVVVIMILGILAGVAAPKLLSVSSDATENGLKQTLSIVRDAIELYTADNGGNLPPCAASPGADFKTALAPYIRGVFPKCPVGAAKNDSVSPTSVAGTTTPDASAGTNSWMYNTADGTFIINSNMTDSSGTSYSSY